MVSGFRTKTDDGVLQIDQRFKTYQLIRKSKVKCTTLSGGSNGGGSGTLEFTHKGHILVAIRNERLGELCFLRSTAVNGDRWTIIVHAPQNHTVELFIFSYGNVIKARHGFNIYTDDGEVAFSSAVPWMNIARFCHVPATGISISDMPESTYALVPPAFSVAMQWRPPMYMMMFCMGYNITNKGFSCANTLLFERPASVDSHIEGAIVAGVGLLVDVTNTEDIPWT